MSFEKPFTRLSIFSVKLLDSRFSSILFLFVKYVWEILKGEHPKNGKYLLKLIEIFTLSFIMVITKSSQMD